MCAISGAALSPLSRLRLQALRAAHDVRAIRSGRQHAADHDPADSAARTQRRDHRRTGERPQRHAGSVEVAGAAGPLRSGPSLCMGLGRSAFASAVLAQVSGGAARYGVGLNIRGEKNGGTSPRTGRNGRRNGLPRARKDLPAFVRQPKYGTIICVALMIAMAAGFFTMRGLLHGPRPVLPAVGRRHRPDALTRLCRPRDRRPHAFAIRLSSPARLVCRRQTRVDACPPTAALRIDGRCIRPVMFTLSLFAAGPTGRAADRGLNPSREDAMRSVIRALKTGAQSDDPILDPRGRWNDGRFLSDVLCRVLRDFLRFSFLLKKV